MFSINLFSKNQEESEEESQEESGYLRKLLFENKLFKIYQTSSREFVNNIKMWACQRDLNTLHVKNLAQSILVYEPTITNHLWFPWQKYDKKKITISFNLRISIIYLNEKSEKYGDKIILT